jgi:hypothetical protein
MKNSEKQQQDKVMKKYTELKESLNELSTNTLHSYTAKGKTSSKDLSVKADYAQLKGDEETASKLNSKSYKRITNVHKAEDQLKPGGATIQAKIPVKKGPLLVGKRVQEEVSNKKDDKDDKKKWREVFNAARKAGSNRANAVARANGAVYEEVEELDEIKLATVGKIIRHSPKIASTVIGAAVAAHSAEPPKQPEQPVKTTYSQVVKKIREMLEVEESYAPVGVRVLGSFKEKDHGKTFEYSKAEPDSWGAKLGFPHVIHLIDGHKRFAHVKGTVAHVVTDEDEHGKPVIDKWKLKRHDKYVSEDVEDLEEVLNPSMGAGEYVKDFEKSDAPQFKDKSKEKRQQMAIAAYLSAKRKNK